jgi:GNAT superfamily N-acetyltransferase
MKSITIKRFQDSQADSVINLMHRNFFEVNIRDYSTEKMQELANRFNAETVKNYANTNHSYVATIAELVVGCGSIASFWGSEVENILLTIFVLPDFQGKGIGTKIIQTLENDDFFLRAKRIEIPLSITACDFYRKLGYDFKDGLKKLDEEGSYRLEKHR